MYLWSQDSCSHKDEASHMTWNWDMCMPACSSGCETRTPRTGWGIAGTQEIFLGMHPRSAGGGFLVNQFVKRSTFSSMQHYSLYFSLGLLTCNRSRGTASNVLCHKRIATLCIGDPSRKKICRVLLADLSVCFVRWKPGDSRAWFCRSLGGQRARKPILQLLHDHFISWMKGMIFAHCTVVKLTWEALTLMENLLMQIQQLKAERAETDCRAGGSNTNLSPNADLLD